MQTPREAKEKKRNDDENLKIEKVNKIYKCKKVKYNIGIM